MFNNPIMQHPHDHIMANTWRLILEQKFRPLKSNAPVQSPTNLEILEQVLPDYRLIGLSLADNRIPRRYS